MILLDSGEVIKKIIRTGGAFFLLETIFIVLLALVPIGLYKAHALENLLIEDPYRVNYLLLFFYGIWLLICWVFLFASWLEYHLGAWIITDARIMYAKPVGFLKREMTGVRLDKIKDVVLGVKGSVKILLTNDDGTIVIPKVRHPEAIKELIVFEQKKAYARLKDALSIDEEEMGMV